MGLEELTQPIRPESIEEHERMIKERMFRIELEYIDGLVSGRIKPIGSTGPINNIKDLLSNHTEIDGRLWNSYRSRVEGRIDEEAFSSFKNNILDSIADLYKSAPANWIEKTEPLIKEELDKVGEIKPQKPRPADAEMYGQEKAGLLNFNVNKARDRFPGSGLTNEDPCITIHLEPLFTKGGPESDVKNLFSSSSLEKLAVEIVDKHPEIKAVVASSWLLDTPVAQRIGFNIFNKKLEVGKAPGFWWQFINREGQIDQDRIKKFFETGEPPYFVAEGAIMTEDFLRKYLPQERRGKIMLKELKPGFDEDLQKEREIIRDIGKNWDKVTDKDIENEIYNKCPIFKEFIENTKKGKILMETLLEGKRTGKSLEEITKTVAVGAGYNIYFEDYLNTVKYTNREVVI